MLVSAESVARSSWPPDCPVPLALSLTSTVRCAHGSRSHLNEAHASRSAETAGQGTPLRHEGDAQNTTSVEAASTLVVFVPSVMTSVAG